MHELVVAVCLGRDRLHDLFVLRVKDLRQRDQQGVLATVVMVKTALGGVSCFKDIVDSGVFIPLFIKQFPCCDSDLCLGILSSCHGSILR